MQPGALSRREWFAGGRQAIASNGPGGAFDCVHVGHRVAWRRSIPQYLEELRLRLNPGSILEFAVKIEYRTDHLLARLIAGVGGDSA
jgi:hypothetical protein